MHRRRTDISLIMSALVSNIFSTAQQFVNLHPITAGALALLVGVGVIKSLLPKPKLDSLIVKNPVVRQTNSLLPGLHYFGLI